MPFPILRYVPEQETNSEYNLNHFQGYDPAELPGDEVHFSQANTFLAWCSYISSDWQILYHFQDIGFITIHGSARYDQVTSRHVGHRYGYHFH